MSHTGIIFWERTTAFVGDVIDQAHGLSVSPVTTNPPFLTRIYFIGVVCETIRFRAQAATMTVFLFPAMLLTIWVTSVCAQDLIYHDNPREIWRNTFNAIGVGNGVFLSPSKDALVVVSRAGILRAYDPADGSDLWTFSPPLLAGTSFRCQSGITFVETPQATTYLAYMIVDNAAGEAST